MASDVDVSLGLKPKATLILEKKGVAVLDEEAALLLALIDEEGSILKASKSLGIAYSKAWETLAKVERVLRVKIVEAWRGGRGGGAKLTDSGKALLTLYKEEYLKQLRRPLTIPRRSFEVPDLIYAGSHDLLLEKMLDNIRERGVRDVEVAWVGSSGGLALLMLGEADLAGVHLYDPLEDKYNLPYLSRYWLNGRVVVVKGYERELVFASRAKLKDPLGELLRGKLRLVNRNLGSGTRVLLDYLIERRRAEEGLSSKAVENIKGYEVEVKTHLDVARAVAQGEGDVGLTTKWAAKQFGLKIKHVAWEQFDFVVLRSSLKKKGVEKFLESLSCGELQKLSVDLDGYRIPGMAGNVIYE